VAAARYRNRAHQTTKPAGKNFLQQQAKFDDFVECYNNERPHQALNMRCPAECYLPSNRPYTGLPALDYPFHDKTVAVTTCGRICFNRQKINLSTVFAGQNVGIKQVSEEIWLVSFMDYDLGYFDHETCRLEPLDNPFGPKLLGPPHGIARSSTINDRTRPKVLPMSPE
jgi:putative transposase